MFKYTIVLLLHMLTPFDLLRADDSDNPSTYRKEAFFKGSCERWNPCTQVCRDVAQQGGVECSCHDGFILSANGFSCHEATTTSTLPPEYQAIDATDLTPHGKLRPLGDTQSSKSRAGQHINSDQEPANALTARAQYDGDTTQVNAEPKLDQSTIPVNRRYYGTYLGSNNSPAYQSNYGYRYQQPSRQPQSNSNYQDSSNSYNQPKTQTYTYNTYAQNNAQSNSKENGRGRNRSRETGRLRQGGTNRGKNRGQNSKTSDSNPNIYDTFQSDAAISSLSNSVIEDEIKANAQAQPKPIKHGTCGDMKCRAGGKCVPDKMRGGVRCQCPLGTEGETCEKDVVVKYPKFMGMGYMAFPLLRGAYREFTITMEFRPDTHNGLLLFSSETLNAKTDFFSVSLMDGRIEFRFDCGTGLGVITTDNAAPLGEWSTVTIHRRDWEGSVTLNDGPEVSGRSRGLFSRITFREDFYLGGYRNLSLIGGRTGIDWGFVGCVKHLTVNGKEYDMRKDPYIGDAIHGVDVGECSSHVCDAVGCKNGARCVADSADTSVCMCPVGVAGDRCESKIDIYVPSFDGTSFMQFIGLRRTVLMFTEIEIVFKPTDKNGLLLYNGYRTDRTGDYISLAMMNGFLEFRFDLGTGPAVLRSAQPLRLDAWHTAKVTRTGRDGKMMVDNQPEVAAVSKGAYTQLTLTLDLFLGGHRNFDEVSKSAEIQTPFKGCIQKVIVNEKPLKILEEYIDGVNIENCEHPCLGQPCENGGRCIPIRDTYKCSCPLGFESTNCELKTTRFRYRYKRDAKEPVSTPMFSGGSFLMYDDPMIMKKIKGIKNDIELRIKATAPNGLLLWAGENDMGASSDYLAVGMDSGHALLRFNLGSGEVIITYNKTRIDDGKWHKIRVQRYQRVGSLEVDGGDIIEGTSPGRLQQLNVANKLYLGGMHVDTLAHDTLKKFTTGFEGCISNLTLATKYHINLMADVVDGENIRECSLSTNTQ